MDHHFMMWSIVESVTHTQQEMEQGDHTNSVIVLIVIIVLYEGNVEILNIISNCCFVLVAKQKHE